MVGALDEALQRMAAGPALAGILVDTKDHISVSAPASRSICPADARRC